MSRSYPLVVFGDDWGRHVSSMQHLLRHLFAKHPTVWVNGIGHRVPGPADVKRAWEKGRALIGARARRDAPPAPTGEAGVADAAERALAPDVVVNPVVVPFHHWRIVEPFNRRSLTRTIRQALDSIGGGRPMVVTGSPPSVSVMGHLDELGTVYFCMDDWAHLPSVSPHMLLPLERRLLDGADAVVATARALTTLKRPRSGDVHYLPQGVNYAHFSAPRPVPAELAELPRPWIGFAGGVGPALDLDALHAIAALLPEASIVLVGPEQPGLGEIRAPNVHRLGNRAYEVLPAYVQAFDVGIIPYLVNPWTESVDPLKLLEYLAAGIPVVTTDLPEVRKYASAVSIASGPQAFAAAVRAALDRRGPEHRRERQAVAYRNTWQSRAEAFEQVMDGVLERRASHGSNRLADSRARSHIGDPPSLIS